MQKMFTQYQIRMLKLVGGNSVSATSVSQCLSAKEQYTLKTLINHKLVEQFSLFGVTYFRTSLQGFQLLSLEPRFKEYDKVKVWCVNRDNGVYRNQNSN